MTYQPVDIGALASEIDAQIRALPPNSKTEPVRAVRRQFTRRLVKTDPHAVIELAYHLLEDYGYRWIAYELVHDHRAALRRLGVEELERFGQGMASWDAVDGFCADLAGPAWREGQISDAVIHRWAHSEDRWWRRAALVATVTLNVKARGGSGDTPRTLAVCRLLVADHDDMVVKALSWALRALVQHDPEAVRHFLAEYDTVLAARVKREVGNKLETGLKNPRRK